MGISVEWVKPDVCVVRVGRNHHCYGDPYWTSCTGVVSGKEIMFYGLGRKPGYRLIRGIERLFRTMGYIPKWKRIKHMDAEIKMTVMINGTEYTTLTQKFNSAKELTEYQWAVMEGVKAWSMARVQDD